MATSLCCPARISARSFPGLPAWPFTQVQVILWILSSASSSNHRSLFLTVFPFQPHRCQFCSQPWVKARIRYWLSECSTTSHGYLRTLSAWIAESISARLLVVDIRGPDTSRRYTSLSLPTWIRTAPHPPGPGFGKQLPSVYICTHFIPRTPGSGSHTT